MANEIYHRSNWGNAVNDIAWGDTYEKFDATNEMFVRSDNYENSNETDKLMAAISPKPSILLTPTAYDNGSLHSVKPVRTFGSELITNGGFDTDSDWSYGSSWSIANGKATATNSTTGSIYQDVLDTSKIYKATFEITEITSGGLRIGIGVNFSSSIYGYFTETGIYTYYGQPTTDGLLRINPLSGTNASIDNVSVKEVIDADFDFTRGSSATRVNEQGLIEDVQILSGELVQNGDFEQIGSELVTNGDFDTDSDWTKGTGWSISGGKANADATFDNLGQTGYSFVINKTYKVTYEVKNYVNGNIRFQLTGGATLNGNTINSNGIYTQYVKATANHTNFRFRGTNFTGSIDNVSVKEVGQNWDVTDGWSIENGKANIDTSEGTGSFNQLGVLTVGKKYRLSLSAAMTVGRVKFQSDAAGVFIFSSDVSSHEFIASSTSVSFRRFDTTTSGYIDNVSIIEITDDTDLPRIDYTDGTGSLLLEPQSTNLVTDSAGGNYGNNPGSEILTTAPDGTNTAVRPVPDSTSDRYQYTISGGSYATDSKLTYTWYRKRITTPIDTSHTGDLKIQILVNCTQVGSTTQIETDVNGFDRFQAVFNITDGSAATLIRGYFGQSIGVGNSSIAYWGHQVEPLEFSTSLIPTSGSPVTRDADVCNNSGSSDLINSTEGVLYAEIAALADDLTFRGIALSDGTNDNRVLLRYRTTSNQINLFIRANSTTILNSTKALTDITSFSKIAIKYKSGDIALWVDGQEAKTHTNTFTLIGLDRLNFDAGNGSDDFYGKVKCIAVFKEALTDEELTALTT